MFAYPVSQSRSLCLSYLEFVELFGCADSYLSSTVGGFFFSHYFFNYFFYLFLFSSFGTPIKHMLICLLVSRGSLRFCSFFLDVCLGGVRLESGGIHPRSL